MNDQERDARQPRSKVARLIKQHNLDGLGEELEVRWTAAGDDHWSLRDLAADFNREIIKARLYETGHNPSEFEVETICHVLLGDDVGDADRTQLQRQLERDGVDADELERELVSYQAIRNYLKDYRGVEYESDYANQLETVRDTIQRLRGRLVTVTESKLKQLQNSSNLTLGTFRVMVDIHIFCTECNAQYTVGDLLAEGGCQCETATTEQ